MKNATHNHLIKNILSKVYIENDQLFHVNGRAFPVTQRGAYQHWSGPIQSFGENTGNNRHSREKLIAELAGCLYSTFYISGDEKGIWPKDTSAITAEEKNEFMNRLSAANQTQEVWDPLWTVVSNDPSGNVYAQKNGITRMLISQEWQPAHPLNGPLQPGAIVSLLNRKERRDLQPVFYYVYSQAFMPHASPLGRFYFNLKAERAADLIQAITTAFNRIKVPFQFKCLNHPALFHRTDGAVLYIEKPHFHIAARLLKDILKKNTGMLKSPVPLFSKRLATGLSYAEDPGNGKSFGMFWTELLAEGIVKAYEKGIGPDAEKEKLILQKIQQNGLSLEESYRKANSFFPYDFNLLHTVK